MNETISKEMAIFLAEKYDLHHGTIIYQNGAGETGWYVTCSYNKDDGTGELFTKTVKKYTVYCQNLTDCNQLVKKMREASA